MTIFAKHYILFVSKGYALIKLNKILVCCHLFCKKIRTGISGNLFLTSILSSHHYIAMRHTLITLKHMSFILNLFTLSAEY